MVLCLLAGSGDVPGGIHGALSSSPGTTGRRTPRAVALWWAYRSRRGGWSAVSPAARGAPTIGELVRATFAHLTRSKAVLAVARPSPSCWPSRPRRGLRRDEQDSDPVRRRQDPAGDGPSATPSATCWRDQGITLGKHDVVAPGADQPVADGTRPSPSSYGRPLDAERRRPAQPLLGDRHRRLARRSTRSAAASAAPTCPPAVARRSAAPACRSRSSPRRRSPSKIGGQQARTRRPSPR